MSDPAVLAGPHLHGLKWRSGGEQQRIAVARAVAPRPALLLADEPTAQLDHETAEDVTAWLQELVVADGTTLVVTTHEADVLAGADRVLELRDGRLETPAGPGGSGREGRPGVVGTD